MHVQIAVNVAQFDQMWQFIGERRLDLSMIFTKLRRNVRHTKLPVYFFFRGANDLSTAVERRKRPLVQTVATLLGQCPQIDLVSLIACEIYQRGAIALWRDNPQITL